MQKCKQKHSADHYHKIEYLSHIFVFIYLHDTKIIKVQINHVCISTKAYWLPLVENIYQNNGMFYRIAKTTK
jgi:hypothetical protein